jgi:uncharacterized RDD family membrane protein YckC
VKTDPIPDPVAPADAGSSADLNGGGEPGRPSIAGRLMSRGARNAQRVVDAAGLDEAIEAAVEEAIVRALESEATERAIARVLNGPLVEQAVTEALRSPEVEAAIIEVLDSETATRVWDHVLEGPHAQRLVERVAEAPEVRAAIAAQGIGLIGDLGYQISRVTRVLDLIGERVARRILLRDRRVTPTNRAGLFTRALALGIDAVIVNFSLVALGALISALGDALGIWTGSVAPSLFAVGAFLWFLFSSLYLFIFWSASGQTIGMRFLDIRIERHGDRRIGPRAAFRRLVGFWMSAAIFGLGFIGTLLRIDRRGFHDRLGDTVVYFIDPADPDHSHERPVL